MSDSDGVECEPLYAETREYRDYTVLARAYGQEAAPDAPRTIRVTVHQDDPTHPVSEVAPQLAGNTEAIAGWTRNTADRADSALAQELLGRARDWIDDKKLTEARTKNAVQTAYDEVFPDEPDSDEGTATEAFES